MNEYDMLVCKSKIAIRTSSGISMSLKGLGHRHADVLLKQMRAILLYQISSFQTTKTKKLHQS